MPLLPRASQAAVAAGENPAAASPHPRWRLRIGLRGRAVPVLLAAALPLLAALAGCAGGPEATGELRNIQDDRHRIADPGILGASATGQACAITKQEALTSAERVAQFNLRRLTGSARYNVRFDPVSESHSSQGVCVVVSALAIEPLPYNR